MCDWGADTPLCILIFQWYIGSYVRIYNIIRVINVPYHTDCFVPSFWTSSASWHASSRRTIGIYARWGMAGYYSGISSIFSLDSAAYAAVNDKISSFLVRWYFHQHWPSHGSCTYFSLIFISFFPRALLSLHASNLLCSLFDHFWCLKGP